MLLILALFLYKVNKIDAKIYSKNKCVHIEIYLIRI